MKKSSSTLYSAASILALLLLIPAPGNGLTYAGISDETLADRAELIVEVQVLVVDPSPDVGRPVTDYRMAVEHVTLGDLVASPLTVRVIGGILPDGMGLHAHGAPSFAVGGRALLFLKPAPDGTYRVLHFLLGAFHLVEHDGQIAALRRLSDAEEVQIPGRSSPRVGPRDLERFRAWLEDRIVGVERDGDYFIDNESFLTGVREKFTILTGSGNGRKIRWPGFSGNVSYRAHVDGQPGVSGGGFSQASTAVSVWRNDPDSDVRIVYSGTTAATGGLNNFDGVNAFLFADPNNNDTFDEPFTCSQGGTIAIGGPWFGSTHTHNGEIFNTAAGGDVVTNKGIDCLSGGQPWFGQRRRAEEVFAHEVGHTLGLGHSCGGDNSPSCSSPALNDALMRANIHGDNRGAQLESDDRAGIRFLYGEPLTPPAAPSGLSATAVSNSRIDLSWSDNSNDEESFDLERATSGGSFNRIALLNAGSTSYQDATPQPNTTYRYRLRAFNDGGASAYSNIATATTFGETAPSDLSAFGVSDSKIRLFWTDTSTQESGFEIEGRMGGAPFTLFQTVPAGTETADIAGLSPVTTYTFRVRAVGTAGTSGYSNQASTTTYFSDPDPCVAGPETLCLNDGRFKVELTWTDPGGQAGTGKDAGLAATDSGLLYFFSANNWEILVKVLDACASESRQFWVFAAATTDVAYDLVVTDSVSGFSKTYSNAQGVASPAVLDTSAFPTCFAELPASAMPPSAAVAVGPPIPLKGDCLPSDTRFCFNGGRYAVEIEWRDFVGNTGFGRVDPLQSGDSGLQWFFDPNNLEVLVKVLDGCPINGKVWVFSAATTNVEYTLRVTDTETDVTREYFNPLGTAAAAITDTAAFDSCP